jgi:hypothetical protein
MGIFIHGEWSVVDLEIDPPGGSSGVAWVPVDSSMNKTVAINTS